MSLSHNRLQTGGWARQENGASIVRTQKQPWLTYSVAAAVMPMATGGRGREAAMDILADDILRHGRS